MADSTKNKVEWYDECVALQQDGELAQAVSGLKELLAAYPDYSLAWLALGVFLQEKGDEEAALEAMQKACELEQEDPFYFTAFSALAIKCGNHEHAEAALMRAQEIRFAAQLKKMNELRNKELADRAERDRIRAEQGDAADDADQKPDDAASAADAAN